MWRHRQQAWRTQLDCVQCHNTVFGSKRSAICAQAVYFLHSTMHSVTCLRLSDVSVICRITYFQFPIQVCFSSTSVNQAAQRRTWFTQYWTSDVANNLGRSNNLSVKKNRAFWRFLTILFKFYLFIFVCWQNNHDLNDVYCVNERQGQLRIKRQHVEWGWDGPVTRLRLSVGPIRGPGPV